MRNLQVFKKTPSQSPQITCRTIQNEVALDYFEEFLRGITYLLFVYNWGVGTVIPTTRTSGLEEVEQNLSST